MTQDIDVFPAHLATASPEERKKYFSEYEVLHPRIELIFSKVMQIIHEPAGKQIIFIIGPTGVGKSFHLRWLISELNYEWSLLQHRDPGRIPVAWIEVPAKDTRNPSWGDYYIRVLESLSEPLIEKKIEYADVTVEVKHVDGERKLAVENATIRRYRRATESAFKHRRPLIFLLDEAHQLINTGGLRVEEQMENLKSIANMTKTLHGLFSTYKILDLLDLDNEEESDQLIRRGAIFHFMRYRDTPDERDVFENVVYSFQKNMPFKEEPNILQHTEYLYERTVGCVGILRDWLVAAYTKAVNENAAALNLKHLKRTCLISKARSVKMLRQFTKSEAELEAILDSDDEEFREFVRERHPIQNEKMRYGPEKDKRAGEAEGKKTNRSRKKPGKQNPKRRRIG